MAEVTKRGRPETHRPPYTLYAVALLYVDDAGGRTHLGNWLFGVSGVNPLTSEEAVARAKGMRLADWDAAANGPVSDWRFASHAVSRSEVC